MTVAEALITASARLAPSSASPRLDAELLLASILEVSRGALFARGDEALSEDRRRVFESQLDRRADQVPVAYLLGTQGFWTLDLLVNPDVLVPRPETELLVEWALEVFPPGAGRIADLGTGSGALALALASERPQSQVLATDISTAALGVAQSNAMRCGIANLSFAAGSWFEALHGRFDLIVANPPYIAAGDPHLPALRHEPLLALSDQADGLACLREIIADAGEYLLPRSWLLVEHGYDQGAAVRAQFERAGFVEIATRRDLDGNERASGGRRG
ncbi:MAG: hemK protein [Hydrocarboniphaga sp.]|uniref:peptide chain release factor N(5)-glutamine methyltransferase n=1 Tax=Hydrocarboniphaga sp. TaxID=2033016 RepID=UPI00263272F8|nr:peptide chain release factor N(5)-glutamine methyltransferase [Hydrocarboniphaga sp.]MDB5969809.1 hemK protein [Hydrocarboniphaga sp.]